MSSNLEIMVNLEKVSLPPLCEEFEFNLVQFLRGRGLTGAKQVCGEGGCGACTVIISRWDQNQNKVVHHSATSCLVPLTSLHHCQVTTIEGLANLTDSEVHPVCEAFFQMGASQCGFCTPGFITNFVTCLENNPELSKKDLERIFDGNLCRCTGYRPILSAASVFCVEEFEEKLWKEPALQWRESYRSCKKISDFFPEDFKKKSEGTFFKGRDGRQWQLAGVVEDIKSSQRDSSPKDLPKFVGGNTDQGCLEKKHEVYYDKKIQLNQLDDLQKIHWLNGELTLGAGVTVSSLHDFLGTILQKENPQEVTHLRSLYLQCRHFANNQIRNMATIGGGLINCSHYSDLIPLWVAIDAVACFYQDEKYSEVPLDSLYESKPFITRAPGEFGLLVSLRIPKPSKNKRFSSYKYSRRRMDSITFLSAGTMYALRGVDLEEVKICFDGLGRPGFRALQTEQLMQGQPFDRETLKKAMSVLKTEIKQWICNSLPEHLQNHQVRLAQGILVRLHAEYQRQVGGKLNKREQKLIARYPQEVHHSHTFYEEQGAGVIGKGLPHHNAKNQTTGKAHYTADMNISNTLFGALVTSPVAAGDLKKLDASEALESPDVIGFYQASDIPGTNKFGFRVEDDEVLASQEVGYVGQPLGILVARTDAAARKWAKRVKISIDEKPAQLTFKQALKDPRYHGKPEGYRLIQGEPQKAFQESQEIVEGEIEISGQYPFYLEPHCANVIPADDGFKVYSSTQSPSDVVDHVSNILDLKNNQVAVKVGRIGGGFGSKQLRAGPIAGICALAAFKTQQPVNLSLSRAEDMSFAPGRSPVWARYKAGINKDGKINALEIHFYLNGGFTNDYSADITECATLLMDSCYRLDNVIVHGYCLKMNYGSYTATRGFGKPQASAIIESVIDHLATRLKRDPLEIRESNLYRKGDLSITQTSIKNDTLFKCWRRVIEKSQHQKLLEEVNQFNKKNKWLKRGLSVVGSKGNMGFLESDDINRGLAVVHILRDGTASVHHSGCEMGQGINTRLAQVTAHSLKIPLELVNIEETQSSMIPNTPPTTMVATDLIGHAIIKACEKLNQSLSNFDGSHEEKVKEAYRKGVSLTESGIHTEPRLSYDYKKQKGDISYFFVWGAALSVVELDIISGSFRVIKTEIVQDCGNSLNPLIDVGQVEGGFLFGLGYYTLEEMIYTDKGKLITDNVSGYKIPAVGDAPLNWDIELLTGVPSERGLHNSKGIGEANIQLGLSAYFGIKEAMRAARREAGMDEEFVMGFPASVDRVCKNLPSIENYI